MTGAHEGHSSSSGSVLDMVAHAAHLLPMQAPLHAFVHHNTMHAFEHLPFADALRKAAATLGAEPYPSEERFIEWMTTGRITPQDIDEVLSRESRSDETLYQGGPSELEFRKIRLQSLFEVPARDRLDWVLSETPILDEIHPAVSAVARAKLSELIEVHYRKAPARERTKLALGELYALLDSGAPLAQPSDPLVRRRDQLLARTGIDIDLWTHELLIRFASAYLDQGVAYWRMEDREQGMLTTFRRLWSQPFGPMGPMRANLAKELAFQHQKQSSAEETIVQALAELGHAEADFEAVIRQTLLSLRGWAGMVRRLEERPDLSPVREFPCSLVEFLAIQLTIDKLAARYARDEVSPNLSWAEFESSQPAPTSEKAHEVAFDAFVAAQMLHLGPWDFKDTKARDAFLSAVYRLDSVERRRLLFLAYERHYQSQVYDALSFAPYPAQRPLPSFQAVLCIDDREESFRRYIEELDPKCETFGYAGFFSVPMRFQGLEDRRPRPLCPPVIEPKHTVYEMAISGDEQARYLGSRRAHAERALTLKVSSTSLLRGSFLALVEGLNALSTMATNVVAPGLGREPFHFKVAHAARPRTRLALERLADDAERGPGPYSREGFTLEEMAGIVGNSLSAMGAGQLSRLFYLIGHGSNSVNNPHSSAYNCGATGGGHGGPNARAFAQMANHPGVRALLAERGRVIPKSTWFIGGCHDTANDSIELFDEDLIPEKLEAEHEQVKELLVKALEMNAQERCRRFESAKLGASGAESHAHVHARAADLGQPRPELGHATNALCVVGRRSRTERLFLDRRAFLVSYDPTGDSEGKILESLLRAVVPVGSGISLEYYFSTVDSRVNGAGTKLPHNVAGLVGVMDGPQSDLRTGLPWQMVEIHEPMRLLCVIEAE